MSNPNHASSITQFRVGVFTVLVVVLIGAVTVFVNDRPYWWRSCNLVHINVEDATGLKSKSPIRSLGLEIGYLRSVQLAETHVRLGVCITAPVEILPTTKAYIRGEGFLGDKFVELRPVKYIGPETDSAFEGTTTSFLWKAWSALFPQAWAADAPTLQSRNIPMGRSSHDVDSLVKQVDGLVTEMTSLTTSLKDAIDPEELRRTMTQLNKTLENASKTLSPEGGLTTTAQRTLAKLEDAIENMRDQMARINRGEGTVGKLLNDPIYAEEIHQALKSLNVILGRVSTLKLIVDIGVTQLPAYDGARGHFELALWPAQDRYYRLGVSLDPRGSSVTRTTTTTAGGLTTVTETRQVEKGTMRLTGMLGKVLWNRVDVSAGILNGDGTASMALYLAPNGSEDRLKFITDIYSRGEGYKLDARLTAVIRPAPESSIFSNLYARGGIESIRKTPDGRIGWFFGGGLTFDDQDIKLLFALR